MKKTKIVGTAVLMAMWMVVALLAAALVAVFAALAYGMATWKGEGRQ